MNTANNTCEIITGLDREAWLSERRKGISASDISSILGIGFHTPEVLSRIKLGLENEPEPNEAMRAGILLEPECIRRYAERFGRDLSPPPSLCRRLDAPWMTATPDALIDPFRHLYEAKCVFSYPDERWGPDLSQKIPDYYATQTTWQMAVTGAERVTLGAYFVGKCFRSYDVDRDRELIEILTEAAREFYQIVFVERETVPPDWNSSYALNIQARLAAINPGELVELGADEQEAAERFKELKEIEKKAKEEADELKQLLSEKMGTASEAVFPSGGYITRKTVRRNGYTVEPCEYIDTRIYLNPRKKRK